jgi:uncharacterized protein (DUF305 family)
MKLLSLKTTSLALAIAITTVTGSTLLTACSSKAQGEKQAQALNNKTEVSDKQHGGMHHENMNHGNINHNMDLGPADASYDLRFIDGMIPHHEGGVVMAKEALEKSKRPEIKKLANEIIKAQDQEINSLKQWRKAWYASSPKEPQAWHSQMKHMMAMSPEQIQAMRMDMDLGAADGEFDLRFLNGMIPHHQGAVMMAKDAFKKLAQAIISSQTAEIKQMQQWQQTWYKK